MTNEPVRITLLLGSVLVFLLVPLQVTAADNVSVKVAGHLAAHAAKNPILTRETDLALPCNRGETNLAVSGDLRVGYDLYLLVLDMDPTGGVGGATFSIKYGSRGPGDGLRVLGWQAGADAQIQIPNAGGEVWPASGSSIMLVFTDNKAQPLASEADLDGGATAVLGRFYVYAYSEDVFEITRNPAGDEKSTALGAALDASVLVGNSDRALTAVTYPDNVGKVGFGLPGYDPCAAAVSSETMNELSLGLEPKRHSELLVSKTLPTPSPGAVQWLLTSSDRREISLSVFSVDGRLVREWPQERLQAGTTRIKWDGRDDNGRMVASGKYFVKVTGPDGYRVIREIVIVH